MNLYDDADIKNLGRRERKKELLRRKIVTTAIELFAKHSFASVTMEQIAEAVDISRGTLYAYFPVKEAIIAEYSRKTIKQAHKNILDTIRDLPDTRSRLRFFLQELSQTSGEGNNFELLKFFFLYRFRHFYEAYADPSLRTGNKEVLREIIVLGQNQGELRHDISTAKLTTMMEFNIMAHFMTLLLEGNEKLVPTALEDYIDVFLDGARAKKE